MQTRTRFSRDLAIAAEEGRGGAEEGGRDRSEEPRLSRPEALQIERAKKAVKKATAIARTTRGSRDL